jgi:hypothetical protein
MAESRVLARAASGLEDLEIAERRGIEEQRALRCDIPGANADSRGLAQRFSVA